MKGRGILYGAVLLLLAFSIMMLGLYIRQQGKAEAMEERSAVLDELCALSDEVPLGYANEYFRTNKSIIVMKCGETEELKLTANWKNGGKVFVDCSSDSAELSFTEDTWDVYTTMTVRGVHPGVTVARFSTDATNKVFAVWILVE